MLDLKFGYWLLLNGGKQLNSEDKKISTIVFNITKYSGIKMSLYFKGDKVTELEAVCAVEKYLSESLTLDYYNIISEQMKKENINSFDEFMAKYSQRYQLLGNDVFLINIIPEIENPNTYFIINGR
jgi:hypothetical protein